MIRSTANILVILLRVSVGLHYFSSYCSAFRQDGNIFRHIAPRFGRMVISFKILLRVSVGCQYFDNIDRWSETRSNMLTLFGTWSETEGNWKDLLHPCRFRLQFGEIWRLNSNKTSICFYFIIMRSIYIVDIMIFVKYVKINDIIIVKNAV